MRFQARCSKLCLDEHPSHLPQAAETLPCAGEQPLHPTSLVKLVKQSIWTPLEPNADSKLLHQPGLSF